MKELNEEKKTINEAIEDLGKITKADKIRLKEIEQEIEPLKKFWETAQKQRDAIKEEVSACIFSDTSNSNLF